ncbi:MAG: 50S ribosomal protein L6 [Flavobacteriales bacterium]|nr:50S ribosomal protein L6 [Flavobacteriales bacterium]
MSRIGKATITIPEGVEVSCANDVVTVKGKKGELTQTLTSGITLSIEEGVITLSRTSDEPDHRAKHGLYRSLVNNMIIGVSEGYKTTQELIGVGYRAKAQGQRLELALGFSHPIILELPVEVKLTTTMEKGKNPTIELESCDKQLIGQVAAKIRSFRSPEPYKGKGIRFKGEEVRRKAGKTAG